MFGAVSGNSPGRDFAPFSCKVLQNLNVLIVNDKAAVRAEFAYFTPMIRFPESASGTTVIAVPICRSIISHLFQPRPLRLPTPLKARQFFRFPRYFRNEPVSILQGLHCRKV